MLHSIGYAGVNLTLNLSAGRGTVLRLVTPERLRALIRENLGQLREILLFNKAHSIRLFRISSRIIPFASHPANNLHWWSEFATELAELGVIVRDEGMRVSMHPSQYTVLSSPNRQVTSAAIEDLVWHARFLEALGLDYSNKLVIHLGGVYGDKAAALERWVNVFRSLESGVQRRVVVENDERLFGLEDVLAVSPLVKVPVVLDLLHYRAYPGSDLSRLGELAQWAFDTWTEVDGIPKIHVSSQAAGLRRGAHAVYVNVQDLLTFLQVAPDRPFDCMLEAKAKDLALFRLREELQGLGIVEACLQSSRR